MDTGSQQRMVASRMPSVDPEQGWQVLMTMLRLGSCIVCWYFVPVLRYPIGIPLFELARLPLATQ